MEKTKNKGKKIVLLVCGILLALAVVAGGAAAVLFMNNGSASEEAEYSGEVQVQDEETLRAALKSKSDCEIVLSGDVVITKELMVNGNKKLSGGSIIMDMRREGSNESVLSIQKGAKLVLDGTTIDGNSVVNCISVKAGGELDSQSGSLVYGYPYGLDVSGKVTITDILIDEALHTGVNVAIFGEVDMLGGTISHNVYGVAVAEEARMDIADGVSMTESAASFIINYGVMDVRGGRYEGACSNAFENWGTMDIRGTVEKPIEICNGSKSAINSKNNAKLTAEHINIQNMAWHGMCVEKNAKATLKNISFDTTGKSTLYVNSAKATIENISIVNGVSYGVYGTKNADVTMTNVTIKDMGHRAVVNEMSTLTADGLVIENSVQHGVYTTGDSAVTTVNNATITGTERGAFTVAKGKGTITNSHIADTKRECVSIAEPGTAIIEDCTIDNAGNFGIGCYGGVANVKNTTFTNSGNASVLVQDNGTLTGEGLTIKNAGKQAIRAEKGGVAKVTGCTVNVTGAAAVYANGGKITLKSAVINNPKTYGVASQKCKKENGHVINLQNVTVNYPGEHGIGSLNGYIVAVDVTVNNSKRSGIYSEGAESIINMNEIEVNKAGSCGLGFKGAAEITARNITINSPTNEGVYAFKGANVKNLDNITIKDPGTHGISVEGGAVVHVTVNTKFNPDNKKGNGVTVLNPGKNGIRVKEATLTAKNVTIQNAGGQGISANTESDVTVNGCTIDTTVQAAVYAGESKLTLKNATIDNAGSYAVAAQNGTKEKEQMVQLTDVEINKPGGHAIGSLNGYIVAINIKVNDPKRCGVYSEGEEAIINMNQVEVTNAGSCGFGFKGAKEITARNVRIESPTNEGIYAFNGANVKKLDNITINKPGSHGISVEGEAVVNVTVDTNFNPDNTKGNGVTIVNAETHGIRVKGATLTATGATVTEAKLHGVYGEADAKVTLKKSAIASPVRHGIAILASATANISETTITNAGERGLYNEGKLTLTPAEAGQIALAIDTTADHGIYLGANANVEGSGLTIKNAGNNGIFSEGADMNISNFNLENTAEQGVQLKNGTVTLSNINFKEAGKATIYVRNNTKLTLTGGTIAAYSYGVATTDNAEVTVKNVTIEKGAKNGSYSTNALINAEKNSKVDLHSGTKIDGKNKTGDGVNVVTSTTSVILNGATFANIADGNAAVYLKGSNTTIKLQKALTEAVTLKPSEYTEGLLVAEKVGEISNADFKASTKLLVPLDEDWSVNSDGCLSNPDSVVAVIGTKTYSTLEAAVEAANASAGADVITVLKSNTVRSQLKITDDVTITADEAITVTADFANSLFNITSGTVAITGASETAKITFVSGVKTTNIVYNNGGTVSLTNVELAGNVNSTAGNNSTYGIYNNAGHITAKSVTIHDLPKGDGINIRTGASADLDNVTISNTGRYGLKTFGTVNIYNTVHADKALSISNTADHAIDIDNGGKAISNLVNVPAGTYAITVDTTTKDTARGILVRAGAQLNVSDVSVKNAKGNGVDLLGGTSVASISNAIIGAEGYAIQTVASSSLTVSNVSVEKCTMPVDIKGNLTGEITFNHNIVHVAAVAPDYDNDGNIEYWYCTICNTVWKDEARTQVITMAETVLPKLSGAVASIGSVKYASLEAAVAAAEASEGADTIKLLADVVEVDALVTITSDITITADKAVTIQAIEGMKSSVFYVTGGTLTVTGVSEDAKITVAASTKSQSLVKLAGGNANLTNVVLAGNAASTASDKTVYGIKNEGGKVTATNVVIQDITKGDGINIAAGTSADLDNVSISNTSRYGLKTFGVVNVYNALSISNTSDHAIDIDNGGKVISHFENVTEGTYAITIDTTTKDSARGIIVRAGGELNITDVSIQNAKFYGVDLYAGSSVASISNAAIASEGYGINAVANSSLTLGNVTVTGNPAGINLAKDAKIKLNKALTQNITVQLGEYAVGVVVAEKSGAITDTEFAASMALLIPVDTNWIVDATGKLGASACDHNWSAEVTTQPTCTDAGVKTYTCSKCGNSYTEVISALGHTVTHVPFVAPSLEAAGNQEYWYCSVCNTYWNDAAQTQVTDLASVTLPQVATGNVAYMNGEAFQTLEAAITKANETITADTIYLLTDVTVSAQLSITTDMTITASKAVTVSIDSALNAYPFSVASGKSLTVEGTGSGRVTVASTSTSKEVFYNQGALELTNVSVSGGKYAVNNRADTLKLTNVTITGTADNGLHLAGGTTTVTNVTISNVKGHGIGCYADLVLQPATAGEIALTINTTGTSSAKKHGLYASYNASITGSGLSIQNPTNAGFFGDYDASKSTVGVTVDLTNVTVTNTGAQGIQVKKGSITISDFTITGTGSAALRPYDSKGAVTFNLSNGTVTTGSYGLYMDKSTHSAVLTNVIFERTGTNTDVVLSAANSATLTATNVTVNIPSAFTALSINGADSYEGITVIAE